MGEVSGFEGSLLFQAKGGVSPVTMNEQQHREEICEIGRRLYNRGFSAANDGNITVRLNEREILCTPTMVSKGFMKPEDLCKVDYKGDQLAGNRRRTSEVLLHLIIYNNRPDIQAVVHCHPPHATAFAIAHEPIPKGILPEVEFYLGEVPLARYETPGDHRLPETILPYVHDCNTLLLANHGTVSFGPTLETAYFNTEIIDAYCRILLLAKQLGRINRIPEAKVAELLEMKKKMGYDDVRFRKPNCNLNGQSSFDQSYSDFVPVSEAFGQDSSHVSEKKPLEFLDQEQLVQTITHKVISALSAAGR